MDAVSLFSGAGGMDLGFHQAGFNTIQACEMNADACQTFRDNGLGPIFEGDVRNLLPSLTQGMADIVFGGPPCQGISVAGKMDPTDPRTQLIDTFLDAVEAVRPTAFVMENVDALLALAKWRPKLDAIKARAMSMGYGLHCMIANSADYGVPQSRRRFFAVGVKDRSDASVEESVSDGMFRRRTDPVSSGTVFKALGPQGSAMNPATSRASITFSKNPVMRRTAYAGMLFNGAGRPIDPARPAPTMTASAGGNKTHMVDEEQVFGSGKSFSEAYHQHLLEGGTPGAMKIPASLRRLTAAESAAFQGFPKGFTFHGRNSSVYRQIGNAVPVGLAAAVAGTVHDTLSGLAWLGASSNVAA
ncbi:DNA cytosine methyltransferase [Agrobacterium rubi]|nr:DNA cytosine methyltransferase [Agrobacterium rubi]NTF24006.1 DNA cytosine methyltransferase [Agrobacterium rubi]